MRKYRDRSEPSYAADSFYPVPDNSVVSWVWPSPLCRARTVTGSNGLPTAALDNYDLEAERRYLGAAILVPSAARDHDLEPQCFFREENRVLYRALVRVAASGDYVDGEGLTAVIDTVREGLAPAEAAPIIDLARSLILEAEPIETMGVTAKLLKDLDFMRRMARLPHQIEEAAFRIPDPDALANRVNALIKHVTDLRAEPTGPTPSEASALAGADFADLIEEPDEVLVEYVPGLLNEGTYILAGAPKLGKSWLTLSIAQGLAMGGAVLGRILVEPCDVLYLCLEDGRRRFKRRAKMRAEGLPAPERGRFQVHFTWPKLDDGGAERLEGWVAIHSAAGRRCCVVIDTGIRLRPGDANRQGDTYRQDYEYLAQITDIMQRYNALCIVVTHTRKAEALDFIDMVIGSHGITGAVEGVLVFTRERHSKKATLLGTDKDGEEIKVVFEWNEINGGWIITDNPDEATEQRQRVMRLIDQARAKIIEVGRPMTMLELRVALAVQRNALTEALSLAVQWGRLRVAGAGKRGDPERFSVPEAEDDDAE
jgi:hypothetical protein